MFHVPDRYRITTGSFGSDSTFGNNGAFFLPNSLDRKSPPLKIIASDGAGWEHVSVSLPHRCPTWPEMSLVKGWFWDDDDCVVQFHPPRSEYVNNHAFCLHLWRPTGAKIPTPPSLLVGYKALKPEDLAGISSREAAELVNAASAMVEGPR